MVRIVAVVFVCSMIVIGLSILNGCSSPKTERIMMPDITWRSAPSAPRRRPII